MQTNFTVHVKTRNSKISLFKLSLHRNILKSHNFIKCTKTKNVQKKVIKNDKNIILLR